MLHLNTWPLFGGFVAGCSFEWASLAAVWQIIELNGASVSIERMQQTKWSNLPLCEKHKQKKSSLHKIEFTHGAAYMLRAPYKPTNATRYNVNHIFQHLNSPNLVVKRRSVCARNVWLVAVHSCIAKRKNRTEENRCYRVSVSSFFVKTVTFAYCFSLSLTCWRSMCRSHS